MDIENRIKLVNARLTELLIRVGDCEASDEERTAAATEVIDLYGWMMLRATNLEKLIDITAQNDPEMRAELDKILLENPLPIPPSD